MVQYNGDVESIMLCHKIFDVKFIFVKLVNQSKEDVHQPNLKIGKCSNMRIVLKYIETNKTRKFHLKIAL